MGMPRPCWGCMAAEHEVIAEGAAYLANPDKPIKKHNNQFIFAYNCEFILLVMLRVGQRSAREVVAGQRMVDGLQGGDGGKKQSPKASASALHASTSASIVPLALSPLQPLPPPLQAPLLPPLFGHRSRCLCLGHRFGLNCRSLLANCRANCHRHCRS